MKRINKIKKQKVQKFDLDRLLEKALIIKLLIPEKGSEKYKISQKNLKKLNLNVTVERVVFYKLLLIIVSFILLMMGYNYYLNQKENELIFFADTTSKKSLLGDMSEVRNNDKIKDEVVQQILINTIELQPDYKTLIDNSQFDILASSIKKSELQLGVNDDTNELAKKTMERFLMIANNKLNPTVVMLLFLVSVLSSSLVNLYLYVNTILLNNKIESEFRLLELLTLVLIKNSTISVDYILFKLRDYSKVLKPYFNDCLVIYPYDRNKAIENLISEVSNPEFTKFMFLIQQNLTSDRETNVKLLESQKNLRTEIAEERYKAKVNKLSKTYALISFPIWGFALALLFIPILLYVSKNM